MTSMIKVDEIQNSAGTTTLAKFENGQLTGALSPATGFKNRVINGDMRIDQRNNGAAVTANETFSVDRWKAVYGLSSGSFSMQQDTSTPTGFTNSIKWTVVTAGSLATANCHFRQEAEGFNVSDLDWGKASAQPITLSFWCRSSITGTHSGVVRNSDVSRSYPFAFSIVSADTWEYKSVAIEGDASGTWFTDNRVGLRLSFNMGSSSAQLGTAGAWSSANLLGATGSVQLAATSGATFFITGVQLEKGTVATPFEFRSIGQELGLCQRYYWQQTTAVQGGRYSAFAGAQGTTSIQTMIAMPVTMRADPTVTASSFTQSNLGATPTAVAGTSFNGNSLRVGLTVTGATSNAVGNVNFDVTLSSEL